MEVKVENFKLKKLVQQKFMTFEEFNLFVKDIVKCEAKEVFRSLVVDEGIQVGKKQIDKSRNK